VRKTPYKTWLLAGVFLLMPWVVHAAGLGKLTILSALGQPLSAEVDLLSVQTGELATLVARLAPPEAFTQANISYSPALVGVRMSIERRADGQPYIKIISTRPVNEPFIDLLVVLSWPQGRLVREYTALIDPVGYTPAVPVAPVIPSVAVTPPATPEPQPIAPAPEPPAPEPPVAAAAPVEATVAAAPAQPVKPAPAPEAADKAYGPVKRGETLFGIASKVKPEGVTVEQMLVGLYHANPDAFADNMNHLKTGKILRVPEKERVIATDQSEAVKEVRVEAANWNAYRRKLAEAAGETPAREPQSAASGKITAKVDDKDAGKAAPKEVLKLSKGEPAAGKASAKDAPGLVAKRMQLLEEEAIAREKALAEANNRIAQLEKTIKNMQHILEIKGQVPAAKPVPQSVPPAKADPIAKADAAKAAVSAKGEAAKTEPATDLGKATGEAPASEPKATPAEKPAAAELPKDDAQQKPKIAAPPPPAPDLIEEILGDPVYLAAAGGVLALLGLYLFVRRRRAQTGADKATSERTAPELGKKVIATAAPAATSVVGGVGPDLDFNFDLDAAPTGGVAKTDFISAPVAETDQMVRTQPDEIAGAAVTQPPAEPDVTLDVPGDKTVVTRVTGDSAAPTPNMIDFRFDAMAPVQAPVELTGDSKGFTHDGTLIASPGQQRKAAEPEPGMDIDFSVLDKPEASSAPGENSAAAEKPAEAAGVGMPMFEPDFKLDFDGSETAVPLAPESAPLAPEFKLDDINLNLEEGPRAEIPKAESSARDGHWYDVQAKFDLAKAYQEMGEKGGAREILEEVIKEGDAEQRAEAQKLLESLD